MRAIIYHRGHIGKASDVALRMEQLRSPGSAPNSIAGAQNFTASGSAAVGAVPIDETGKFQIANLSEGRYHIDVQTPPGSYVAFIQQGGANVFDDGFSLDTQNAQLPIRIQVNMAGETVEGNVRISQAKDAASAMVVLVPALERRNNPAFYKTATTDAKGHFIIRSVAPGFYTAFAWESVLPGAYQNADFLEKYQLRGRALNLQAGTRSEIQLYLIQEN